MIVSCSSAETVESSSLSLESVDNVESGDGLSLGVFGVHNGVADNVLEEASEDSAGLLIDVRGDSLDATTSCESADSWLGNAEDAVSERSSWLESLGSGLASGLALSASSNLCSWCHCVKVVLNFKLLDFIRLPF